MSEEVISYRVQRWGVNLGLYAGGECETRVYSLTASWLKPVVPVCTEAAAPSQIDVRRLRKTNPFTTAGVASAARTDEYCSRPTAQTKTRLFAGGNVDTTAQQVPAVKICSVSALSLQLSRQSSAVYNRMLRSSEFTASWLAISHRRSLTPLHQSVCYSIGLQPCDVLYTYSSTFTIDSW